MFATTQLRVGYWLSEKKQRNLRFKEFNAYCRARGITLIPLDLSSDLESQGPFDCIIHKLSDIYAKSEQGDVTARRKLHIFDMYLSAHPKMAVLDPPEAIGLLCSRITQYEFLASLCNDNNGGIRAPAFVQLTSTNGRTNVSKVKMYGLQYPLVCKPLQAHGSTNAHQINLVFNSDGVQQLTPPFVAQSFLVHDAVLFKLFVIGEHHFVMRRPSLKNYVADASAENVLFDSQTVSKKESSNEMTLLDNDESADIAEPSEQMLQQFVSNVRARSGLSLFGVDLICHCGHYYAIDVNVFPSYDGVAEMFSHLYNTIVNARSVNEPRASCMDSGVGTSASESDTKDVNGGRNTTSNAFPDWQRIKRFYGIPKPQRQPLPPPRRLKTKEEKSSEVFPVKTPDRGCAQLLKTRTNSMP